MHLRLNVKNSLKTATREHNIDRDDGRNKALFAVLAKRVQMKKWMNSTQIK